MLLLLGADEGTSVLTVALFPSALPEKNPAGL